MRTNEETTSTKRHYLPRTSVPGPRSGAPAAQPRRPAAATTKYADLRPNISHESDSRHKQSYQVQTTRAKSTCQGDFGGLGAAGVISSAPPREHFWPCVLAKITKIKNPTINFQSTTHQTGPR